MQIRAAKAEDAPALALVVYTAVHEGPSFYTPEQRAAWMPALPQTEAFAARLAGKYVAKGEEAGIIMGFMTLEEGGYIDLAFILPEYRGRGLFRSLATQIEATARMCGEPRLWTHASLTAQPAFRAIGFSVIQHEMIERAGETLARAEMEKGLT
jgi:putative acetyltransferase